MIIALFGHDRKAPFGSSAKHKICVPGERPVDELERGNPFQAHDLRGHPQTIAYRCSPQFIWFGIGDPKLPQGNNENAHGADEGESANKPSPRSVRSTLEDVRSMKGLALTLG